jgi:RNA polymerase sigma factor (sigma-70 family)
MLDASGPALYSLLTKLTLRQDVAEELMQELFIKLNKARNGRKIENFDAYARRAAVNLAFDWRRKHRQPAAALQQVPEPTCLNVSPLTSLIEAEELEETLNAIGRLDKVSRQAVVMRYIRQESYEHIAEQLGRSPHHVRALCARAMDRLRNTLMRGRPYPDQEVSDVKD